MLLKCQVEQWLHEGLASTLVQKMCSGNIVGFWQGVAPFGLSLVHFSWSVEVNGRRGKLELSHACLQRLRPQSG